MDHARGTQLLTPLGAPHVCFASDPQEDAPLSKVYQLLRTLGLRHICVVPR